MKLDKDILQKLKDKLPHGGLKQISERLQMSYEYTCAVFSGNVNTNEDMINEARKIIREEEEKKIKIENQINKL